MSGVVARGASLLAGRFITLSHPSRWTSRQRVGGLIALSAVLLVAIMAVLAIFLTGTEATLETNRADEHAAQAVELLVTVGSNMPELNRSALESGLAGADRAELDHAVERGRHDGILSSLTLWNVQGRAVYGDGPVGRLGGIESSALRRALHGSEATVANPGSMDFNSGKRTGTLDSFEPLRDDGGRTFGVAEVSRPLSPSRPPPLRAGVGSSSRSPSERCSCRGAVAGHRACGNRGLPGIAPGSPTDTPGLPQSCPRARDRTPLPTSDRPVARRAARGRGARSVAARGPAPETGDVPSGDRGDEADDTVDRSRGRARPGPARGVAASGRLGAADVGQPVGWRSLRRGPARPDRSRASSP